MNHDDAHTSHNHGFELPNAPQVVVHNDPRPWRAVAGVAVCLGLAGIVTGLIVARRQSVSDAHLTSDALQREELRDGWRALGAAAVRDAQDNDAQATADAQAAAAANRANAPSPPPSVVIVTVPAQGAPAAPSNVTNINLPNGTRAGESSATTDGTNPSPGFVPVQSVPPINYSPVPGYVPTPVGYPSPPANYAPQAGYSPQNSYGTTPGGVPPAVGNGSIPGASPNPASTNSGLVGSTPTPGSLPNGSPNSGVTPNTPVGPSPVSPSTPTLPSGFSAP